MLTEIFKAAIILSAVGGALTMLLFLLKPLTERFLGMKWQYLMWIAVFVVMLCPLKIKNDKPLPKPITQGVQAITVKEVPAVSVFEDATGVYMSQPQPKHQSEQTDLLAIFAVIWCVVALGLFLITVTKNVLLKNALYGKSVYLGNVGKGQIRESDNVGAPLLMGVLKPVLYIPQGLWGTPKLDYVTAHEEVHLKRCDVCIKWFAVFVKCLHWFNPFVYIAWKQLNEACEISCDGTATRLMSDGQKKEYMNVILEVSEQEMGFRHALSVGLSSKGRCVRKRFAEIMRRKRCRWVSCVFGTVIIITLSCYTVYAGGLLRGCEIAIDEPQELFLVLSKSFEVSDKTIKENNIKQEETVFVNVEETWTDTSEREQSEIRTDSTPNSIQQEVDRSKPITENKSANVVSEEEIKEQPEKSETEIEKPEEPTQNTTGNDDKTVFRGEFNSEGGDTRYVNGVVADENGCLTVGIKSNTQETVDVYISESSSGKEVHSMGVPVPYEAAYVMEGLEPGKTYDIVLKGEMRNDWNIESEYIIY